MSLPAADEGVIGALAAEHVVARASVQTVRGAITGQQVRAATPAYVFEAEQCVRAGAERALKGQVHGHSGS